MKFTLALAQIDNVLGDVKNNVKKHCDYIRKARDGGADLVIFPELSLTGYSIKDTNWDVALSVPHRGEEGGRENVLREIIEASGEISILAGGVEESEEFGIHNSAFYFENRMATCVHRKIYPPTYGMFEELRYFSPGKSVRAFESRVGRIGALICEDLWHLPLPYILAKEGAKAIIGIAASPTRLSGKGDRIANASVNTEQHKAYARLLSSYMIFCNRVGVEDGVNFWGGSEVVGPGGDVLVQAKLFDEDLVFATIDDNEVRRARRLSRHFIDDDPRIVLTALERILASDSR